MALRIVFEREVLWRDEQGRLESVDAALVHKRFELVS
jgi:hypothetical protein